jgi:GntR family transcriptional regulator, transcriptional repressor for pyruvate dehydrogenase complex
MINSLPRHPEQSHDLNVALLRLIASNGPIGQSTLALMLRKDGFSVSVPTVGRRLQELQFQGLLEKVGVDGRILTELGRDSLTQWEVKARLARSSSALLETLKGADKEHILDLLSARRVIECETAFRAAARATPPVIVRLESILHEQARAVKTGALGSPQDVALHKEIARASGSPVLHSIVTLLRSHESYDLIIASMRAIVGTKLVEDHRAILRAIRDRNPQKARRAMDTHLQRLMSDINRYWKHTMNNERRDRN